ncbi:DUF5681 domain-containing protein [Jannaschia formosa]|uniref:DUF5681 domain-containing protein n=1 Tax=Jannaschia formosa TaxID=2259592 RepID=UPI000E1B641B|nr:DUF5681 domain-containing protein [Jannaschia formosa]TFL16158.1 hypothetical protein DR046_21380 [Jannaschia formosa]
MTADRRALPSPASAARYEVGYAKPPVETRFKPGQSGNPKGRPKGSKNRRPALNEERLKDIILAEAYREITVRDSGRDVTVPMAQAIVRALAVNAAKGQHRAQRLFAEMLTSTERQNKALADEWLETAINYKIEWDGELHRRAVLGITHLPPPLPHPDQVKIDLNTGTAWIEGPATKDDVEQLELWERRHDEWTHELESLRAHLEAEQDERVQRIIREDIERVEQTHRIIGDLVGKLRSRMIG